MFAAAVFTAAFTIIEYPVKYNKEIAYACERYGVEESLLRAVIKTESGYNKDAVSDKGARGLMQLMPSTAAWVAEYINKPELALTPFEPAASIELGTAYLQYLCQRFSLSDAIAAYNAGEGNVAAWLKEGNGYLYKETRIYVKKVLRAQKIYKNFRLKFTRSF